MALSPISASTRSWRRSARMKVMVDMGARSSRREGDAKAVETAQRVVVAAFHRSGDFDGRDLARQCRQHHLAFQPSDQLPHTHMDAGTEADMTAGLARDVVALRIDPSPGIAGGRAQQHQDFLALADTAAADLDVLRRGAKEGLHRR